MPASAVLTTRELNRALLARQFLLERRPGPGARLMDARSMDARSMIEHLVGMQAQAPFPPYYGLLSRLDGFRPEDLATLLEDRSVVRIALMRGTIHLVSARDAMPLRRIVQPVIDRMFRVNHGKRLAGVDLAELAARGRELVDATPMTFSELGAALAARWPDHPPADLAQGVRALVPLVQVPPRAVWGKTGLARHTSAQAWLGPSEPAPSEPAPSKPAPSEPGPSEPGPSEPGALPADELVRRYLAAFGPASVKDVQAWSGLTGLRAVVRGMRGDLLTFQDHNGVELFDLPHAPRPPAGTPAPVSLVAEFDNLILSHADRARVIGAEHWPRVASPNGVFPGIVLIDGFAAGLWRLDGTAVAVGLWARHSRATLRDVTAEAERLAAFAFPAAEPRVSIAPLRTCDEAARWIWSAMS